MKKLVINISDSTYERLRFESIKEKKSIRKLIQERIFFKPFHEDVEEAFDKFMEKEIKKILKE